MYSLDYQSIDPQQQRRMYLLQDQEYMAAMPFPRSTLSRSITSTATDTNRDQTKCLERQFNLKEMQNGGAGRGKAKAAPLVAAGMAD
jgi:hypothetical protein